jgi:2-aminoethylphosphonate-pyruvate transaminase
MAQVRICGGYPFVPSLYRYAPIPAIDSATQIDVESRTMTDPILLTPGPLTTSETVKRAMLRDWGSRDTGFIALTARVRTALAKVAGADPADGVFTCVPLQGSGTFAVEATIDTLVPRGAGLLVLINGAYGERIAKIAERLGRRVQVYRSEEHAPPIAGEVEKLLAADPGLSHIVMVHCETTAGILNPLGEIAEVAQRLGRALLVDAMSSFGALPIDVVRLGLTAVIASSNKCLEGVPGMGFIVAKTEALKAAAGNAVSLSLDLADQWQYMEKTGQWRFTPPTHVLSALDQAITEFEAEGGVEGRGRRYAENCKVLIEGMTKLGFEPMLSHNLQAPIIVTFRTPVDPKYDFEAFYDALRVRGYAIYPGKLTKADSFRIGCIGRIYPKDLEGAVAAVKSVVDEMGITQRGGHV